VTEGWHSSDATHMPARPVRHPVSIACVKVRSPTRRTTQTDGCLGRWDVGWQGTLQNLPKASDDIPDTGDKVI
jgi:hypothetical protein